MKRGTIKLYRELYTKESNFRIPEQKKEGPLRESNPGPLAPKARIIPLDQAANLKNWIFRLL